MAKPRVIISTDIGGADPDDMESMAHALLVADQWDIKALVSTPSKHGGRTSDIHKALDAYAKDYGNLKTWSSDYPTPSYLKSIVHQGSINVAPSKGYSSSTEGSRAIVDAAHDAKAAGEPLWVMAWGSLTDVAQALHDDPSVASTLRVLATSSWNRKQDPNAHNYVVENHAKDGMWMIDSNSTFRGMYINSDGAEGNSFQLNETKGHGALGDYFYWARPWGVKMGDSWSITYLTDQANDSNPGADSWGGTFVKNGTGANFWTDDPNSAYKIGHYNGAKHLREEQSEIYKDMYRLFNRAKSPNPDAGDTKSDSGTGAPSTGGSNDPVYAYDDNYKLDPGKTMWENSRFLTHNDKGEDGGLKVTQVDGTSAQGVSVSWASDGTIKYTAKSGFVGTDTIGYTVVDADGSSDRAKMVITVGDPSSKPAPAPAPAPSGGTGNDVYANNDKYQLDPGKTMWENSRFLTHNDKGEDGGLKVTQVDGTSAQGISVSWASDGTIRYTAKSGFVGTDTIGYTVVDADGSSDRANMVITVGNPSGDGGSDGGSTADPATPAARVLALGDSHTYGIVGSYTDRESGGYRLYLTDKLEDAGIAVDMVGRRDAGPSSFDNDHEGYSGIHIQQLTSKIPDMIPATNPDVVLLMAGSNDSTVNTVSQMKTEMSQLIDKLVTHAPDAQILVAGIPPARSDNTPGMKPAVISGFNSALPALIADKAAAGKKVQFVDTSSLTVADISGLDVDNGVHLTRAGHEKLAGLWLEALKGLGVKDGTLDVGGATTPLPPTGGNTGGGTGNEVHAVDDHYALASGATKWEASHYLVNNDRGGDGRLKVTDVDNVSAQGVPVTFENGTIVYRSKAGFNGTDTIGYTVVDEDGSSDQAKMVFTVGDPSKAEPDPTPEPDPAPEPDPTPTGGTGNNVYAQDDHYDLASGATKWEAARYLTWNDKGGDGPLKVAQVDDTSANGVSVSFDGKTIVYRSEAGFNGTDTVGYTVVDEDGSSDRAEMVFTVGDPSKAEPEPEPKPEPEPEPAPTTAGTGNDVNANNDWYRLDAGKSLWVNSRYFTKNDDGPDGGLQVTAVDAVSANGGRISWVPEGEADGGTTKYTPAADFSGRDSFQYTVVDQDGSSDVATVFVQVVDVFA